MGDNTHTPLPTLSALDALSYYYDFRAAKYQNFEYAFTVKEKATGNRKEIKVWSTSELVAKKQLSGTIGDKFEI